MMPATATLSLTADELTDLRAAARAHRRVCATGREGQRYRATRLALLAPRLTDALDTLEAETAPCPGMNRPSGPDGRSP